MPNPIVNGKEMRSQQLHTHTLCFPVGRATVERTVAALIAVGKVEHRGSKKVGGTML